MSVQAAATLASLPVFKEDVARMEGHARVLGLQQRRFRRELAFSAAVLSADALTIALIFVTLAQLPANFGPLHTTFVTGLIPANPVALLRRITLLLFCLTATRAYTTTHAGAQSNRIAFALALGIVLPRWALLLSPFDSARLLQVAVIVALLWIALVAQRHALVQALHAFDPRRLDQERTLIVGVGQQLRTFLAEHIDTRVPPPPAYEIDPEWPGDRREGWQTLYEEVHRARADAIILVGPLSDAAIQNVLIAGSSAGCRVFGLRRRPLREMNNPTLIRRGEGPIALLSSPALIGWQLVAKRVLDVSGAIIGMIVLSPLIAVCAILVKTTTPGPVIYPQLRVGLGGELFRMLKLRTMSIDADDDNPRITPVGRLLRNSSLDELPQLWNVLRGEMSLVGPRPPLPLEVARYKARHYVRFEVAPGITGPWQVRGRGENTSFDTVIQLEQDYINGWTVWRDLALLLRTVPAVLKSRGSR
ncbi:MAG: sugar transferase [bacterium]